MAVLLCRSKEDSGGGNVHRRGGANVSKLPFAGNQMSSGNALCVKNMHYSCTGPWMQAPYILYANNDSLHFEGNSLERLKISVKHTPQNIEAS